MSVRFIVNLEKQATVIFDLHDSLPRIYYFSVKQEVSIKKKVKYFEQFIFCTHF